MCTFIFRHLYNNKPHKYENVIRCRRRRRRRKSGIYDTYFRIHDMYHQTKVWYVYYYYYYKFSVFCASRWLTSGPIRTVCCNIIFSTVFVPKILSTSLRARCFSSFQIFTPSLSHAHTHTHKTTHARIRKIYDLLCTHRNCVLLTRLTRRSRLRRRRRKRTNKRIKIYIYIQPTVHTYITIYTARVANLSYLQKP